MTELYRVEPLVWNRPLTDPRKSSGRFRASWLDTLDLLRAELDHLNARYPVVVQLDVQDGMIRRDGMLNARARVNFPGVAISATTKFGPLTWATDTYVDVYGSDMPAWQANVRAIALSLEALRAVDRHGVTRAGEQYTGWRALPAGNGDGPTHMTREEACRVLGALAGWQTPPDPADPTVVRLAFKKARANAHPDRRHGDRTVWDQVEEAARVLGLTGGS